MCILTQIHSPYSIHFIFILLIYRWNNKKKKGTLFEILLYVVKLKLLKKIFGFPNFQICEKKNTKTFIKIKEKIYFLCMTYSRTVNYEKSYPQDILRENNRYLLYEK